MAYKLLLVLLVVCGVYSFEVKHLAGPPSEFSDFVPPDPYAVATIQHSAVFEIDLNPNSKTRVINQQVKLPVDSKEEFKFIISSPFSSVLTFALKDPRGKLVTLRAVSSFVPIGDEHIAANSYTITKPVQGEYILTISATKLSDSIFQKITTNKVADVYIILWNEDDIAMHTSFDSYNFVTGKKVGLVTRLIDTSSATSKTEVPRAIHKGHNIEAEMKVVLPNGNVIYEPMLDKIGARSEQEANDGEFGGFTTASVAGTYRFVATINGTNAQGVPFIRTTEKVITVVDPSITLIGTAFGELDGTQLVIKLSVKAPVGQKYYVFAQAWGADESNVQTAVSWIGGMAIVQSGPDGLFLAVRLHLDWISRVSARSSITLKNVVVSDPDTMVTISTFAQITVTTSFSIDRAVARLATRSMDDEITLEMRQGIQPAHQKRAVTAGGDLILVHGYCASFNPWQQTSSVWTRPKYFSNLNANIGNDAFAVKILAFAGDTTPYSCIAHSQGGMAIVHLYQFYWSGLDLVGSGKKLQSVGTPYQGCTAAGSLAGLGKIFGVGCGSNTDLSREGNAIWLPTITAATRKEVSFYTTTYKLGNLFGDYCNLPINAILEWPNDGTTELAYAPLPGATNMGNTQKQCHIPGMAYGAQTADVARNTIMNNLAAR